MNYYEEKNKMTSNPYYKYEDEVVDVIETLIFNFEITTNKHEDYLRTENCLIDYIIMVDNFQAGIGDRFTGYETIPNSVKLLNLEIKGKKIENIPDTFRETFEQEMMIAVTNYYNEQLKMQLHDIVSNPIATMEQMIELLKSEEPRTHCLCHVANDVMGLDLRFGISGRKFLEMLNITKSDVVRLTPELASPICHIYWFADENNPQPRIEYLKLKINELKNKEL